MLWGNSFSTLRGIASVHVGVASILWGIASVLWGLVSVQWGIASADVICGHCMNPKSHAATHSGSMDLYHEYEQDIITTDNNDLI